MNTGQLCKIHQLIQLKHQYKLRLFIDESVSFGSLGKHGKGITEHEKISVVNSLILLLNISIKKKAIIILYGLTLPLLL